MAITRRQRQIYDFISEFVQTHQYSPSYEEIKQGMGLNSLATVHKHISNLEKKGLLTRDYNRSRSIDLLPPKGRLKQSMSENTAMVLPVQLKPCRTRKPFHLPTSSGRKKFLCSKCAASPCRTRPFSTATTCL